MLSVNNSSIIASGVSVVPVGVQILSDLSWGPHSDTLCSKAKKQLGVLHIGIYHLANPGVLFSSANTQLLLGPLLRGTLKETEVGFKL